MFESMKTRISFLLVLSAWLGLCGALHPAIIKGYKFFDSITEEEIVIRGIDYYPRPNVGFYDRNSVDFFTEYFRHLWERDLPYLQQLGVNAVRLYSVDPHENHDAFMCALNQAGIYAVVGLASECPTCAITRDKAPDCYPVDLKERGQAVVQEFAKYTNTLAFSTGNEVNHAAPANEPEWNGPCLKKFMRDMRQFIDSCTNMRKVPLGLVSADTQRDENAMYYNCQGDPSDKYEGAEWYGFNSYVSCDPDIDEYQNASGLVFLQQDFERYQYSIPVVMTEYGCLSKNFETIDGYEGQRDFKQTEWLMTEPDLREQFSGGFVFEYSTEMKNAIGDSAYPFTSFGHQNYGIGYFEPEDCDEVLVPCIFKPLPSYHNLQAIYNQTNSTVVTTMNSFEVPENRANRSQCPRQFKILSHFRWKADGRKDISCPLVGSDSNFTCPTNLDELRGRFGYRKYHYVRFNFLEGSLAFGIVSIIALCALQSMKEKKVESDMSDLNLPRSLYCPVQLQGDDSDESTGLLAMQDLTDAGSKTAYQAIDSGASDE